MNYSNMTEQEFDELYDRFKKFVADSEGIKFELLTLATAISLMEDCIDIGELAKAFKDMD